MTQAERMRRSREALRRRGGRTFSLDVSPADMTVIRDTAQRLGTSESEMLRQVVKSGLEYHARLMACLEALQGMQASEEAIRQFLREHLTASSPDAEEWYRRYRG